MCCKYVVPAHAFDRHTIEAFNSTITLCLHYAIESLCALGHANEAIFLFSALLRASKHQFVQFVETIVINNSDVYIQDRTHIVQYDTSTILYNFALAHIYHVSPCI